MKNCYHLCTVTLILVILTHPCTTTSNNIYDALNSFGKKTISSTMNSKEIEPDNNIGGMATSFKNTILKI